MENMETACANWIIKNLLKIYQKASPLVMVGNIKSNIKYTTNK